VKTRREPVRACKTIPTMWEIYSTAMSLFVFQGNPWPFFKNFTCKLKTQKKSERAERGEAGFIPTFLWVTEQMVRLTREGKKML